MRRGWVWPIKPLPPTPHPLPRLSAILGNCVVLPEPVSPQTITTWWFWMACAISSRRPETGSDSGKVMGGTGVAAGAAAVEAGRRLGGGVEESVTGGGLSKMANHQAEHVRFAPHLLTLRHEWMNTTPGPPLPFGRP